MHLRIDSELHIPVRVEEHSTSVSPHTKRTIRELVVVASGTVSDATHEAILSALGRETIEATNSEGTREALWKPKLLMHSSSGDRRSYSVKLTESEALDLAAITIGSLRMTPYKYVERAEHDEGISIECRVRLTPDETSELFGLMLGGGGISVVRHGISDTPREMRFGAHRWSRHETEGFDKHAILMFDVDPSDRKPKPPFDLPDQHARGVAAYLLELTDGLLGALREKSIVSAEEIDELKRLADEQTGRRLLNFVRENDIDAWDES